ncbi:hypothetical protein CRUP_010971, partial [Coryphaenoides rupestris]
MHWDKSLLAGGSPRPYQGVRVRDPVRELLRRKRGLEQQDSAKTAPPAADVSPHHSPYAPGIDHAQLQEPSSTPGPQPYPVSRGPAAGDMYMQTLCPSYAVTIPLPECPDTGFAYIPLGNPTSGCHIHPAHPDPLPGSTLVHMPTSCPMAIPAVPHTSVTVPQVEVFQEPEGLTFLPLADDARDPDPHPQPHPHLNHPDLDTSQEQASGPLDHLVEPEMEPLNPLEKLLEDHDKGGDEEE